MDVRGRGSAARRPRGGRRGMEADEQAEGAKEEAQRAKEQDISLPIYRAAAYLLEGKYMECVRDCDDAVERGRELSDVPDVNKLIARALSQKASALLKLAACAGDYAPAIRALQQSLAEHYSEETRAKLEEAESARKKLEEQEQERLDREAADHHRGKGNEFFKQKKYREATMHYTQAMNMNQKDPRLFSSRAQCHIYLGALPQGLEDAEKCIELDPTYFKGYVRKAKVQFLMENYENALATYLEGLRCDRKNLEVLDGLRSCAARMRANGGDVEPEGLEEMLGNSRSGDDLHNKFQKAMEQAATFKKEASDERLRRIESERMVRTMEEYLSGVQQQLEQLQIKLYEAKERLREAKERTDYRASTSSAI